ncbi:MAG TPA: hypothetical protein DDW17_02000 [Deltaproteobacteria bacterium]|nr:hypothetical protein [Deltaproteobacteria bacterium]
MKFINYTMNICQEKNSFRSYFFEENKVILKMYNKNNKFENCEMNFIISQLFRSYFAVISQL